MGDAAFDGRSPMSVFILPVGVSGGLDPGGGLHVVVVGDGQVVSMAKSSRVNPPGTVVRNGASLQNRVCPPR
jgi:hypothetical protein